MQLTETFAKVSHKVIDFLDPPWDYWDTRHGQSRLDEIWRHKEHEELKAERVARMQRRALKREVKDRIAQKRKEFEAFQESKRQSDITERSTLWSNSDDVQKWTDDGSLASK